MGSAVKTGIILGSDTRKSWGIVAALVDTVLQNVTATLAGHVDLISTFSPARRIEERRAPQGPPLRRGGTTRDYCYASFPVTTREDPARGRERPGPSPL